MNSDQKRAFLAVILSGAVLLVWQMFLMPKEKSVEVSSVESKAQSVVAQKSQELPPTPESLAQPTIEAQNISLEFRESTLKISNKFEIVDLKSKSNVYQFLDLYKDAPIQLFSGKFEAENILYVTSYSKINDNTYEVLLRNSSIKKVTISETNNGLDFSFEFLKPAAVSFLIKHQDITLENGQASSFVFFDNASERLSVSDEENKESSLAWFGIDFNYHLLAISLPKRENYRYSVGNSQFKLQKTAESSEFKFELIFAKKNYDLLINFGNNLDKSIDFGIWGIIAVPILRGLQFIHDYVPNYGIGIILLTLLIRLITFPLQYKSFVGMKKMQKIQPELVKLREKFKDDPQRMQKETMDLFKKSGANPLGGCLPLLLQMPVFFAFYKVLYAAVELVNAPFILWIHDLSSKDPFFVLPIVMTALMFLQQKLSPSGTMDPTQQKVMLFMPIVFGFVMKDLPSGLVLYILVSTLFGIIQQLFVYKTAKV
jgi:YidC/Oxa1 family membrane protein insertase